MSYGDEDDDYQICDCSGRNVAYRVDGFHLYQLNGKYFGTHGLKRGTAFRTNEIFRGGRYVGEIRNGRLLFDPSKAELKPGLLYSPPRLREGPPRLKVTDHPVPMPPGCRDVDFGDGGGEGVYETRGIRSV